MQRAPWLPHLMSVEVVLFDKDARQTADNTYLVKGDEWVLQGDIIKFPTWLNIVGLHSGYKLTCLEGRYDNSDLERHAGHTVIDLNGGDDTFFVSSRWDYCDYRLVRHGGAMLCQITWTSTIIVAVLPLCIVSVQKPLWQAQTHLLSGNVSVK